MRRFVMVVGLVVGAVACGSEPQGASPASLAGDFWEEALAAVDAHWATLEPATSPETGGTVIGAGLAEIPGGMNGLVTADQIANQHQLYVHLMSLVRFDEDLQPEPYLAESWQFDDQGRQLTFRLRRDIRWHDGTPTTAQDVAFTYQRAKDPETGFPNPGYFAYYDGVEVVDSFTVRFRIRPHAQILDTWRATPILPEHLLGDVPSPELAAHPYGSVCPVGNGPFRFVEHRENDRWTFAANPEFPEALGGRPLVDRYVFRIIPEQTTILAELLAGTVDLYFSVVPDHAGAIRSAPDVRLIRSRSRDYVFVGWNSRRAQLANPDVRRALTLATDRQAMVDGLLGGCTAVPLGLRPGPDRRPLP
jgi:peptide/nickel transport system substrate-binding protein